MQHRGHQSAKIVVALAESCHQRLEQFRSGRHGLTDQEAIEFAHDELRRRWLLKADPDNVGTGPLASTAKNCLRRRVVLSWIESSLALLDFPSREGPGSLTNICFGVMTDPKTEKLHQLSGIILIRHPFLAKASVEPNHHGRILGDLLK